MAGRQLSPPRRGTRATTLLHREAPLPSADLISAASAAPRHVPRPRHPHPSDQAFLEAADTYSSPPSPAGSPPRAPVAPAQRYAEGPFAPPAAHEIVASTYRPHLHDKKLAAVADAVKFAEEEKRRAFDRLLEAEDKLELERTRANDMAYQLQQRDRTRERLEKENQQLREDLAQTREQLTAARPEAAKYTTAQHRLAELEREVAELRRSLEDAGRRERTKDAEFARLRDVAQELEDARLLLAQTRLAQERQTEVDRQRYDDALLRWEVQDVASQKRIAELAASGRASEQQLADLAGMPERLAASEERLRMLVDEDAASQRRIAFLEARLAEMAGLPGLVAEYETKLKMLVLEDSASQQKIGFLEGKLEAAADRARDVEGQAADAARKAEDAQAAQAAQAAEAAALAVRLEGERATSQENTAKLGELLTRVAGLEVVRPQEESPPPASPEPMHYHAAPGPDSLTQQHNLRAPNRHAHLPPGVSPQLLVWDQHQQQNHMLPQPMQIAGYGAPQAPPAAVPATSVHPAPAIFTPCRKGGKLLPHRR